MRVVLAGTTLFASTLGLFLPRLLGVGRNVSIQMMESNVEAARFTSLVDTVKNLIPANPVASFANGKMLQVLVLPSSRASPAWCWAQRRSLL